LRRGKREGREGGEGLSLSLFGKKASKKERKGDATSTKGKASSKSITVFREGIKRGKKGGDPRFHSEKREPVRPPSSLPTH